MVNFSPSYQDMEFLRCRPRTALGLAGPDRDVIIYV